jgi:hypothetical protein
MLLGTPQGWLESLDRKSVLVQLNYSKGGPRTEAEFSSCLGRNPGAEGGTRCFTGLSVVPTRQNLREGQIK